MTDGDVRPSAGFATRTIAFVTDAVVFGVALSVGWWIVQQVRRMFLDVGPPRLEGLDPAVGAAIIAGAVIVYTVGSWWLFGRTVGKALMGLRVVGAQGGRLTLLQSLLRFIGYLLSAAALFLGFLWVLVDRERRAWHDLLARTRVVRDEGARWPATETVARTPENPVPE